MCNANGSVPLHLLKLGFFQLQLLQRHRHANGSRIVIQIGGVHTTFCKEEGILLQQYHDRNGKCTAILVKNIGVRGSIFKGVQTMKSTLWTEALEFGSLKEPNSRFALHGSATFASNSWSMRLFQALLRLSIHGFALHGLRTLKIWFSSQRVPDLRNLSRATY